MHTRITAARPAVLLAAGLLAAGLLAAAVPTAGRAADVFRYEGVCEASAASQLDDSHFVVASDETEELTIYERGVATPGPRVAVGSVTDIEAAARIGDTIFWLTSHSLNKDGEEKAKRKLLFATTVAADGSLAPAGGVFRDMRELLRVRLSLDSAAFARTLDIEGLAATPSGDLMVGLRSPLRSDGKALVVRIADPFGLVGLSPPPAAATAAPAADVSALDLGGRGVRSLERVGERYLIVAGPVEDGGKAPALFWWDGADAVTPGPTFSLGGVTPEALFAWSDGTIMLLGDNGDACSDEDGGPRWFPSLEIKP